MSHKITHNKCKLLLLDNLFQLLSKQTPLDSNSTEVEYLPEKDYSDHVELI